MATCGIGRAAHSSNLPSGPDHHRATAHSRNFVAGPTAERCELRPRSEFDDIFTEILTVADTLTDGIMKQFPEKLR